MAPVLECLEPEIEEKAKHKEEDEAENACDNNPY
jgi:hypothetical protein